MCKTFRLLPLCLCLLVTAIILQDAYALRTEMVFEDEVSQSLIHWIHPAAGIALLLGYGLSTLVIFYRKKR